MQVNDAILEIVKDDVAAILRHRRAHAGFEQFLDLGDDFVVFLVASRGVGSVGRRRATPDAQR